MKSVKLPFARYFQFITRLLLSLRKTPFCVSFFTDFETFDLSIPRSSAMSAWAMEIWLPYCIFCSVFHENSNILFSNIRIANQGIHVCKKVKNKFLIWFYSLSCDVYRNIHFANGINALYDFFHGVFGSCLILFNFSSFFIKKYQKKIIRYIELEGRSVQTLKIPTFLPLKSWRIRQLQLTYTSTSVDIFVNFCWPIRQLPKFKNNCLISQLYCYESWPMCQLSLPFLSTLFRKLVRLPTFFGHL